MPTVITDMLSSKKFLFSIGATILTLAAWKLGAFTHDEVKLILAILWPTYLASQGLADFGKHAAAETSASESVVVNADVQELIGEIEDKRDAVVARLQRIRHNLAGQLELSRASLAQAEARLFTLDPKENAPAVELLQKLVDDNKAFLASLGKLEEAEKKDENEA